MKILCVEQFPNLGGGQLSLLDLLPGFRDRGWQPIVAIPGDGLLAQRVRSLQCEVELFDSPPYANGRKRALDVARYASEVPRLTRFLMRLIRTYKADLLYVNAARMLPMASLAASRRSLPLVFHCHNRVNQNIALSLLGASLKLGRARVISCCRYSAEPLRRYVPDGSISVVYSGVADTRSSLAPPHSTTRRIGVIGRIEPEKGQLEFVAAARLLARSRDCQFVVVGAPLFGGMRYFEQVLRASSDLPIQFLGWRHDVPDILSTLDVLVVPSASIDSAPRVIFEAFAAGVPVVAFPSGGIPEIVRDSHNGFLASAFTSEALAARIRFVLDLDDSFRQSIAANARHCWRERHSLVTFRRDVSEIVAEAAGRGPMHFAHRSVAP